MYTMAVAAVISGICWFFLDPDATARKNLPLEGAPEI
jgi:hypothetical protein